MGRCLGVWDRAGVVCQELVEQRDECEGYVDLSVDGVVCADKVGRCEGYVARMNTRSSRERSEGAFGFMKVICWLRERS